VPRRFASAGLFFCEQALVTTANNKATVKISLVRFIADDFRKVSTGRGGGAKTYIY
jgi:hypothetical protein